ncbi:DEAD/DEAH box helicase [Pseudalkalibacillus sp. A8]|uniref:DEAD/DEAH box helicase n=1 Tax=Pseudalkalibacillus sp. A8 TaxID=3382641 RepID=UPI0038B42C35
MKIRKSLPEILKIMNQDETIAANIAYWKTIPEKAGRSVAFPDQIHPKIRKALENRGFFSLYTHQYSAFEAARSYESFVTVTPTASGKTLCYNLPVLQEVTENENSRALYLFPTKALAQDQKSEINELIEEIGIDIKSYTYDGDTPSNIRQVIRKAGHVVMTNPDMLHSAILPHHTKWFSLFENLKYIVIDELHSYRGVFGSHFANVLRRLKRICAYYGSTPIFICTSATIANPKELAEKLTGDRVRLIDNNGAPVGKKHFVFYNPPIVNKPLNIRRSATLESKKLASLFLENEIQTIVFARSRVRVEILLTYLQELINRKIANKTIRGYRGGYLPKQRREIEQGLRSGEIMGVVSTNALELGVDIGQLQVCVMNGYPGTIASTWQQGGRAGRRQDESVVVLVASSTPLDQYIIQNPDYFFNRNPETARINPDNLIILVDHLKCAAYELPFKNGETFEGVEIDDIMYFLTEEGVLHEQGNRWYWMNDSFPAHNISLRSASQENVVIIDQTDVADVKVIGEMDRFSSMTLLHEEAIYLHQGIQYQVEKLDYEEKKAYIREVDVDYYTDANLAVSLKVLEEDKQKTYLDSQVAFGDVTVNAMATIFKKIKFGTHENIGSGPITLPEEELHTSASWFSFSEDMIEGLSEQELEEGLIGISNVMRHVAPLFVMCDVSDLHVVPQVKASHSQLPTIFFYDRYPGGIGLSEYVYDHISEIMNEAEHVIERCPCEKGCPSCVGNEVQYTDVKSLALKFLKEGRNDSNYVTSK